MGTVTIELPPQQTQPAFNLKRWAELLADPEIRKYEGRVESDRHGRAVMHSIATASHGAYQARVSALLNSLLTSGSGYIACPISTADGVRVADVAWAFPERVREFDDLDCLPRAPAICVEVLSPANSVAEMSEKTALYFDAGAKEVWHCSQSGKMTFFAVGEASPLPGSRLCPNFPAQVELR